MVGDSVDEYKRELRPLKEKTHARTTRVQLQAMVEPMVALLNCNGH